MAPAFSSEALKGIPVTRNMRWAETLSQLGTRRRSISQLPCGVCSGLRAEEEEEFALSLCRLSSCFALKVPDWAIGIESSRKRRKQKKSSGKTDSGSQVANQDCFIATRGVSGSRQRTIRPRGSILTFSLAIAGFAGWGQRLDLCESQSTFSGHGWGTLTVTWGSQHNGGSERAQESSLLFIVIVTVREVSSLSYKPPYCWHVQVFQSHTLRQLLHTRQMDHHRWREIILHKLVVY